MLLLRVGFVGGGVGVLWGVGFLREAFTSEGGPFASPFLLVWLLGWTFGGGVVISVLLWNLIGREVITFEHGVMTVARRIGPLGLPKRYDLSHVRDARVVEAPVPGRRLARLRADAGGNRL